MEDWKYDPAHDLGLSERERLRSIHREPGLIGWGMVREAYPFLAPAETIPTDTLVLENGQNAEVLVFDLPVLQ